MVLDRCIEIASMRREAGQPCTYTADEVSLT